MDRWIYPMYPSQFFAATCHLKSASDGWTQVRFEARNHQVSFFHLGAPRTSQTSRDLLHVVPSYVYHSVGVLWSECLPDLSLSSLFLAWSSRPVLPSSLLRFPLSPDLSLCFPPAFLPKAISAAIYLPTAISWYFVTLEPADRQTDRSWNKCIKIARQT